jgi:YVTN family beta-propeller protein
MKNYILVASIVLLFASHQLQCQSFGNGTLVVLNKSEASVSLIDLNTGKETNKIKVGEGPHEVAIQKQIAVVTIYGGKEPGNTIEIIDLEKEELIRTIDLGKYQRPHGVSFIPNTQEILVTSEATKTLLKVNIMTKSIIEVMNSEQESTHMVIYADAIRKAFTANIGSGSITVFDIDKNKKLFDITTGKGSEGLALNKTGSQLWVTNRGNNNISVVDTRLLKVIAEIPTGNFPIRAAFTNDDSKVLISNAKSGTVEVFDANSYQLLHTIQINEAEVSENSGRMSAAIGSGPIPIGIVMHPKEKIAYIANTNADIVTVIDLDKMKDIGKIKTGKEPDGIAVYLKK